EAVQRIVAETVRKRGIELIHPKQMTEAGFIVAQIESEIHAADIVIAILTGKNPNCVHEIALAESAKRPVLLIAGSDKDLYFDIRHLRCMMYGSAGELDTLAARLDDGIATTLAKMPAQPEARQIVRPPGLLDDGIAAFLGPTLCGPLQPVSVTSWTEFTRVFGAPLPPSQSYLGYAVRGFFENGGREAWIVRVVDAYTSGAYADVAIGDETLRLYARNPGAWANRIALCLEPGTRTGLRLRIGATDIGREELERLDSAAIPADWEDYDNLGVLPTAPNNIVSCVNERSGFVEAEFL